jgi:homoserine kinase type II
MAVFTTVTDAQLAAWLQHYSLGQVLDFRGIATGIENSNFFLTTSRGEYVLTIFEKLSAVELPFYLELMRHLAMHAIPVPDPVPRTDGTLFGELHGKPAAIVTRLAGVPQMATEALHCAALGGMLAKMHLAGQDFPLSQPNLRSLPWWQANLPLVEPYLPAPLRTLASAELAHQAAFFGSADYAALPGGPCHGDLFRDNALFVTEAGQARLGGFFDFYFAGCDKWLFDIAVCVNDWCIDQDTGALDAARSDALLLAYQGVRPLTAAELRSWPDMLRTAAMRFWVSRLYDFYLPREAAILKAHDPAHFERILRTRIHTPTQPPPRPHATA